MDTLKISDWTQEFKPDYFFEPPEGYVCAEDVMEISGRARSTCRGILRAGYINGEYDRVKVKQGQQYTYYYKRIK